MKLTRFLKLPLICVILISTVKAEVEDTQSANERDLNKAVQTTVIETPKDSNGFGIIQNPNHSFEPKSVNGNFVDIEQIADLTEEIKKRNEKFDQPPNWMLEELSSDHITDKWE